MAQASNLRKLSPQKSCFFFSLMCETFLLRKLPHCTISSQSFNKLLSKLKLVTHNLFHLCKSQLRSHWSEWENSLLSTTTDKQHKLQEEADKHYCLSAERIRQSQKRKVLTFSPSDLVSIWIAQIDRISTDFYRLTCVVVERLGTKFHLYQLRYYFYAPPSFRKDTLLLGTS